MTFPHIPVLLHEVLQVFQPTHLKVFVDGTLGAGGHAEALLAAHPEIERYIGFDQDRSALEIAEKRLAPWAQKLLLIHDNFSHLKAQLAKRSIHKVDGLLLDLGVSSMQFDQAERGFSFTHNGPLDMRMNKEQSLTAAMILNEWSEKELGRVFREYGEEKRWRAAAQAVVQARSDQPLVTTHDLVKVLSPLFSWKKKGINPLTLIFQGLRICVNDELEVIQQVVPQGIELLSPKGRMAVISFHSMEDRIIKTEFRFAASNKQDTRGYMGVFIDKDPTVRLISQKPLIAGEEELHKNPRSRSAKLRAIEKL